MDVDKMIRNGCKICTPIVTTRLGESDFTSIFFSFGLKNEKSGWLCNLNIHNSEQVLKYNHSDQKRN